MSAQAQKDLFQYSYILLLFEKALIKISGRGHISPILALLHSLPDKSMIEIKILPPYNSL